MSEAAVWIDVRTLLPWDANPVVHTPEEVGELRKLIATTVWTEPIAARGSDLRIIAGHRRRLAALEALAADPAWMLSDAPHPGFVPVRLVEVDDDTAARLAVADNAMTKQSAWDRDALKVVAQAVDLCDLGMTDGFIQRLLRDVEQASEPQMTAELEFRVVVDVVGEQAQLDLIERLEQEGFKCRPLIS